MEHGRHSKGHLEVVTYHHDPDKPYDQLLDEYMASRRFTADDPATLDHERPDWDVFDHGLEASRRLRFQVVASTMFTVMCVVWLIVWFTW